MDNDQYMQEGRDAIGRSLSSHIAIERDTPDHLKILLRQLRLNDDALMRKRARGDRPAMATAIVRDRPSGPPTRKRS